MNAIIADSGGLLHWKAYDDVRASVASKHQAERENTDWWMRVRRWCRIEWETQCELRRRRRPTLLR